LDEDDDDKSWDSKKGAKIPVKLSHDLSAKENLLHVIRDSNISDIIVVNKEGIIIRVVGTIIC
jgi:hypothetical protein